MKIIDFFKERILFIFINILILVFTAGLLSVLKVDFYAIVFIFAINLIGILVYHIYDYFNRKRYYEDLLMNLESLDKKYLIADITKEGSFLESKILYYILNEVTKSMKDDIAAFRINNKEYREYIELWVHEVKTPIASSKLIIENNKSELTESIDEEITKVESYIEQALFYARSNDLEKDYIIKELDLRSIVNKVIRRNSKLLIEKRIKIETLDLEKIVYTDSKWIEFILNQIVSNSIKYIDNDKLESKIKFYTMNIGENVVLYIEDTGIGMNERDVIKAFEKGYTGENGRKYGKSTGIGLYLCKKLTQKLGLGINIESEIKKGTKVLITFPINKMMLFK
ncbi:sensor histidine kinase [Clostridium sp. AL.422]|uniref:sensor histidine kinase n=1 Tax=Clostridium TaxID=1485 RepID=UPI00293DBD2E|nr:MULTISPECIES: sensor histidine kinase [unclassified Clostridium]MDV4150560.1 sensor histidine kinase [Clostridium sp. AL.422]